MTHRPVLLVIALLVSVLQLSHAESSPLERVRLFLSSESSNQFAAWVQLEGVGEGENWHQLDGRSERDVLRYAKRFIQIRQNFRIETAPPNHQPPVRLDVRFEPVTDPSRVQIVRSVASSHDTMVQKLEPDETAEISLP